jgi:phage shock protein C
VDKTITVTLNGHAEPYRLTEDAYDRLSRYLDRAASRLRDDADRAEVLGDLERSVGDKLAALLRSGDRLITPADIDAVLEQIGTVDTGHDPVADEEPGLPKTRRLRRIRKGQQLAGVCNGLAAYSDIRVDWVRTGFILATLATGGIFGIVYVALALILRVDATRNAQNSQRP